MPSPSEGSERMVPVPESLLSAAVVTLWTLQALQAGDLAAQMTVALRQSLVARLNAPQPEPEEG